MDLSATQVIASLLAAVTGAVAASFLGVAGTIIGTAVMSVASTAVAAIYKHYLATSRERIRAAADAARVAPMLTRYRATEPGHDLSHAVTRADRARATTREDLSGAVTRQELSRVPASGQHRAAGPDDETQVLPAVASRPHRWDDTDRANGTPRDGDAGGRHAAGAAGEARWRRPRPLVLAAIALGVFLLAMAGITAFEAVAGKPLNALVGGGPGSGTTIGHVVGGSGGQAAPRHPGPARPFQGSSPAPRSPAAPTPTPSQATTPAPTPSPSPAPSPDATTSPGAGASPGQGPGTPASARP